MEIIGELNRIKMWKMVRKSWGSIDPRTKYKPSEKIYKRSKEKNKWRQEEQ